MELKSLFLGVLFAVGVFAVKSGIGLHYFISQKRGMAHKVAILFAFACGYLILFIVSAEVAEKLDLIEHFAGLQRFLKSGIIIYFAMALGLLVWGVLLLRRDESTHRPSLGWVALIVPCPVCASVIFYNRISHIFLPRKKHICGTWGKRLFFDDNIPHHRRASGYTKGYKLPIPRKVWARP